MGRPELSRSGHTTLGEHGIRNQVDPSATQGHDAPGSVPPGNQRPMRPGIDPDGHTDENTDENTDLTADDEDARLEDSKADDGSATVDLQLRVGAGFTEDERPDIVRRFASLDARLRRFAAVDVDMELSINDRDRPGQKVTLECWIARMTRMVATSHLNDLDAALIEVRDDLRRQINDAKTKTEPRNSRQRRATIPNPIDDGGIPSDG